VLSSLTSINCKDVVRREYKKPFEAFELTYFLKGFFYAIKITKSDTFFVKEYGQDSHELYYAMLSRNQSLKFDSLI